MKKPSFKDAPGVTELPMSSQHGAGKLQEALQPSEFVRRVSRLRLAV